MKDRILIEIKLEFDLTKAFVLVNFTLIENLQGKGLNFGSKD